MQLSVIIVSYNVKHYLRQCLRSVYRALDGIDGEVWVVDNHSRDGSADSIRQEFPAAQVIASQENLGFARGNNLALRQCEGRYVLLLNPDTLVGEDVLRECVQWMDEHPQCGGVGVRMLHSDGTDAPESRRGVPTPMTSFYKITGLCKCFPRHRRIGRYYMGWLPWDEPAQIEIMSGAFAMLRRKALEQVGLLDEDFFMYGEDIDLSYRLLKGGWQNWYLPLKILHYKGESTEKSGFRHVHVFYQAMYIFLSKHYGHLSLLLAIPIRLGIALKAAAALCSTLWKQARRSLGGTPRRKADHTLYVFDVDDRHVGPCRQMARRHGLNILFANDDDIDDKMQSTRTGTTIYWVYDVSQYSCREMLEHLSGIRRRQVVIATYDPDTGRVITPEKVIQ